MFRTWVVLLLLGESAIGFAQQHPATLESLFGAAQQAQARGEYAIAANDYALAAKMRPDIPVIWANLGLMQQDAGDIPAAIEAFQKANRLDPSLYVPNLFLGIDYAHSGKTPQAIPLLTKAEKMNPTDAQAPLALGRAYISAREYSAAIPELDRALKLNPKLANAWFDLGIAQLDQVEADARTISEDDEHSPFAGALYAESLMKQARFGEAASLYKTLLDSKPQPPCLRSEWGFALIRESDESAAAAAFKAERAANPECSLAVLGQARLDIDGGNSNQAFSLLQQLWDRDHGFLACNGASVLTGMPNEKQASFISQLTDEAHNSLPADVRQALLAAFNSGGDCSTHPPADTARSGRRRTGEEYYESGQFALCTATLQRGAAMENTEKLLAACSYFTGDNESAARAATALRKREPHSVEALYWSIKANERMAFASLERFEQLDPDSARSHVLLGDVYQQLERYDDAQSEYQKALSVSPSDEAAMLGLASAYLNNYNPKGAMTVAQNALAGSPDDPELNLVMAQALLDQREYAEAEPYLQKSLNAKPQMLPRIHALLGKSYAETGRTHEAIQELNLGASSDEDGSLHYLLARLYRKEGDIKDSQAALDRLKAIKQQCSTRGVKRVEDPDLSPIERTADRASVP